MNSLTGIRPLLAIQGIFYLLTGIWPLVSIRSFKAVTGEKTDKWTGLLMDHWLVYTVALLIIAVALALLVAAWQREGTASIATLAISAAIGLTTIDIVYVSRGVILPIYLLDAVAELALLSTWAALLIRGRRSAMKPNGSSD
jgi:hypothetical protein